MSSRERGSSRHLSATENATLAMRLSRILFSVSVQHTAPIPPIVVSYETRMPHAALQPYRHQRISHAVDHPRSVSARLEHGAGAVRSSQPALATPTGEAPPRSGTAPWNGPQGVEDCQSARRVALPSSPAETLRLCEPYADIDLCLAVGAKCHDPAVPKAQAPTGLRRNTMFRRLGLENYVKVSHHGGQSGNSKIADPTAAVLYWNALPEVRIRACTLAG